jgi:hypothetical protein
VGKLVAPRHRSARARLVPAAGDATRVRVAIDVTLAPDTGVAPDPTGMLAGEGLAGFPVIWRSETGGLRFILNGGLGVFTDGNPWFGNPDAFTLGNPLVQDPAVGADTGDRIAWFEQWIEGGIAGAVQLGDSNAAVYGALTAIAPFSTGTGHLPRRHALDRRRREGLCRYRLERPRARAELQPLARPAELHAQRRLPDLAVRLPVECGAAPGHLHGAAHDA